MSIIRSITVHRTIFNFFVCLSPAFGRIYFVIDNWSQRCCFHMHIANDVCANLTSHTNGPSQRTNASAVRAFFCVQFVFSILRVVHMCALLFVDQVHRYMQQGKNKSRHRRLSTNTTTTSAT